MGNQPSTVPYGSSINLLNTTLKCTKIDGSARSSVTLPFSISATAPLHVGFLQPYYYGDLQVAVGVPQQLAFDQREAGTYYGVNVSTTLDIPDAGAKGLPITIAASMLRNFTQYTANIPADPSKVLPPQGPVSLPFFDGVYIADLRVKSVNLTFTYLSGNLQPFRGSVYFTCLDQGFDYIVAATYADTQNDTVLAPANGYTAAFPPTSSGRKSSIANIPTNCTFLAKSYAYNLTVGGQGPASIQKGAAFDLTNFNTFLTVPTSVFSRFYRDRDGTRQVRFNVGKNNAFRDIFPGIGLTLSGANATSLDLSRDFTDPKDSLPPVTSVNVDRRSRGPVTFPLPLVASLAKALTATDTIFGISLNTFQGVFTETEPNDDFYPSFDTVCKNIYQNILLRVPVY